MSNWKTEMCQIYQAESFQNIWQLSIFKEQKGFNLVKSKHLWAFMKPDFSPVCFISHFAAVSGPKSPSGRLDLLGPIRAAKGLAQLIWIGMNVSFFLWIKQKSQSEHQSACESQSGFRLWNVPRLTERKWKEWSSRWGNKCIRSLSHSHPHYCSSTIVESVLFYTTLKKHLFYHYCKPGFLNRQPASHSRPVKEKCLACANLK